MTTFLQLNTRRHYGCALRVKDEAKLTVEDFVELSWWGMDDKVGDYAYLQRQRKEKRTGLELKL